MSRGCQSLQDV